MAAISITPGSVIPSSSAIEAFGTAGATILAGDLLYIDTGDSNKLKLCDANASAAASVVAGIARHGASTGQRVRYITKDTALVIGATLASGDTLWSSGTAGGITKTAADNASGVYVTCLGVMTSTTVCNFQITAGGMVSAMSATTHGTAYLFGVDGTYFASAQLLTVSLAKADAMNAMVENNSGQVASGRHDDQADTVQATMRLSSAFTRIEIASKVTLSPVEASAQEFDGDYRVLDATETTSTKGYREYSVSLVKMEYLTLTDPPVNSVAPVASGSAVETELQSCTSGTWTGSPTFAYQWQTCLSDGSGASFVPGETSATWTIPADDYTGSYFRCRVTGSNAGGPAHAYSNVLGPITA